MRRLRQLSMTVFLTLTLGTYAFAGIIDTPPTPAPPPEPPSASATGTISTVPSYAQPEAPATDLVVDIALDLMQSVLSLL